MASGATATANSAKSAATSAVGVANTANTTANSALSKANSAVSVANQANTTANQAKSNANQAVNTANSANTTANQANNKISNIQTNGGGRNLLLGTRDFSGDWINLSTNWTKTDETYNGLSVVETTGDWSGISQYYQVKQGEAYTFSLFARYISGTGSSSIYVLLNSNPESGHQQASLDNYTGAYALDANWKKCSITFTATTDGYIKPRMERTNNNTNTLRVCGFMLEKGTVAHSWQPAPEDMQTQIDANKTAAANAQSSANNAQNTANSAQTSANSALSKANNAQNTANSAQTSANNAQNTANSAQSTANTAIKVSETLKDLGNYTATASGTTNNSTYSGLPRTSGVSMSQVYNNGYPVPYGNVLNVAGTGAGQLLLGWSGTSSANEHLYYRSHRDNGSGGWSTWDKIAYVSDLTWSNISGKPNVATKSDLTWANISGKPSIPNADDTTTVSSGDLNNYTTTGKYYMPNGVANYTNHPTTGTDMGDWFVMKVDAYHGGDMIVQTIYQINSGDVWIRQRWSNAWKSWRQINFWG
ncbi:alanine-zipper protein [Limosilactobacillus mucosae]